MIYKICYLAIYLIENLISLFYFENKFSRKVKILPLFSIFIFFYIISLVISELGSFLLNSTIFFIGNYVILFICYKANVKSCLFNSILLLSLMLVTELIVAYILSAIFSLNLFNTYTDKFVFIIHSTISKMFYFITIYLTSKLSTKENFSINLNTILLLTFFPLGTIVTMVVTFYICVVYDVGDDLKLPLAIGSIIILMSNIIVFYVHEQTIKTNIKYTELLLTRQKEKNSVEYYSLIKKQNENSKVLIHDITKHLNSIKMLSRDNNTDINDYINSIFDDFKIMNPVDYCSNSLLNLITYRYSEVCKSENIRFDVNIQNTKLDFMSEPDITALFDNVLENAIEAAKETHEKFISFSIDIRNTNFLVISITNSSNKKPLIANGNIVTSKKDFNFHGVGIKSIRRVVKKYDGNITMNYNEIEKMFATTITFQLHSD